MFDENVVFKLFFCMLSEHVTYPPLRKCTIVSDFIGRNVSGIWETQVTAFPGFNISKLGFRILQGQVLIFYYMLILMM
jgi:hypothetical protein